MHFISRFKFLCAIAALVTSVAAIAGEPPTEPILRIDPGEHTAVINRISADEQGRWLATASNDKTVRLWSLADGRLLNTLRPPLGTGNEGQMYDVAMSPDGIIVAAAGWTQFNNGLGSLASDGNAIYLFERASGHLLRRLPGLPDIIASIAFSPDGRWLAATLKGNNGVRVFDVASGKMLAEDRDYGGESSSAHFSGTVNGETRLVTTSYDGLLRLYRFDGNHLSLLAKRAAPGGKIPARALFSPDGKRIAVGFADTALNLARTAVVNVLDSDSLALRFTPDTAGINDSLVFIAWSHDGAALFAAHTAHRDNQFFIRRWSDGGAGAVQDWPVSGRDFRDIASLPGGRLAFASTEPAWGVVDATGQKVVFHAPAIVDLRGSYEGFRVSPDGAQVRFGYEYGGKSPVIFDSLNRVFLQAEPTNLAAPRLSGAPGLEVTDWNSNQPKLNGNRLTLMPYERSLSLALWPNGESFALGTDHRLFVASSSAFRWQLRSPEPVWGVNVSADGRWVVAAYGDGTIRWHRASDGAEQLAFYPHPDKKRWVMWTPSGYYDASPGAEDLIGWHVNRGKDHAADFFPASRFRERFNRPDVLAKVLSTQDEGEAVRLANAESGRRTQTVTSIAQVLPPVVEIMSPASDTSVQSGKIKVRYTVRTAADAPVTAIRVRVNGLLQSDTRALKLASKGDTQEIEVNVPEQDAEIQLFAENKYSVSTPAILRLKWAGKASSTQVKPKLYVLAVGVSKYKNPEYNLGLAAKDAQDFVNSLQGQKGKLYSDVVVRLLTDDKATKEGVLDGLDWLEQNVKASDVGIMFVAGHGMNDKLGGYYFMPHNADPDKLKSTSVSQDDIKRTFASLPGHTVFFIDTCYSGGVLGSVRTSGFVNDLASAENGAVVFTASSAGQLSQENASWGNGAFTKSVVEGLNGSADFRKSGFITAKGLDYYVDDRVKTLTHGQQTPVSISPGGVSDFPIAAINH